MLQSQEGHAEYLRNARPARYLAPPEGLQGHDGNEERLNLPAAFEIWRAELHAAVPGDQNVHLPGDSEAAFHSVSNCAAVDQCARHQVQRAVLTPRGACCRAHC